MHQDPVVSLFQKKLKSYLLTLGLSSMIAQKISEQTFFKWNSKKELEITCKDEFYFDQIISQKIDAIKNIVESKSSHEVTEPLRSQNLNDKIRENDIDDESRHFILHSGNAGVHFIFQPPSEKKAFLLDELTFIYGNTGLGKTHALREIGRIFKKNHPQKTVLYVTSNDFVYDIVHRGIRAGKMQEIRKKYTSCDLLCFDDVQFLQKKDACQSEFFSIFSYLRERKKSIFLASSLHPKEMHNMDERLKGRFLQGTMIHLQLPSLADKQTLVEQKCENAKISINNDTVSYICSKISSNICEIDGIIREIIFHKNSKKDSDDNLLAILVLKNRYPDDVQKNTLSVESIKKAVSEFFQVKISDLGGLSRQKKIVQARHIAMYLMRDALNLSVLHIAQSFNRTNHTTVIHAVNKIKKELQTDKNTLNFILSIKSKLNL